MRKATEEVEDTKKKIRKGKTKRLFRIEKQKTILRQE